MNANQAVRPIPLWQSVLLFLLPGLYGIFAQYSLFPLLTRIGMSEEYAYNTAHLSVFLLLVLCTFTALRLEGWQINWSTIRDRLRFKGMDASAWKWTIPFILLYLLAGLLLNMLAGFVYQKLAFRPPDAEVPLTNIPFLLIVYIINIFSEEMWWRGYILPRQELTHGKMAWLVNGLLWSLFHIGKWWAVPFMLFKQWMLPLVAQRTKNTTPAFLIHLISNGFGIVISILPIISAR
jgi:membrane protease YdiL (CAAX protease family)